MTLSQPQHDSIYRNLALHHREVRNHTNCSEATKDQLMYVAIQKILSHASKVKCSSQKYLKVDFSSSAQLLSCMHAIDCVLEGIWLRNEYFKFCPKIRYKQSWGNSSLEGPDEIAQIQRPVIKAGIILISSVKFSVFSEERGHISKSWTHPELYECS